MPKPTLDELHLLHANVCKALGDPKRIQILYTLSESPLNVSALADALSAPQPTVSRHLAILRERALVDAERDGTQVYYSLAAPEIIEILDSMRHLLRDLVNQQSEVIS